MRLVNAKHPMVVLGGKYITEEASALAADIAVLLGKSDGTRRGVSELNRKITARHLVCWVLLRHLKYWTMQKDYDFWRRPQRGFIRL